MLIEFHMLKNYPPVNLNRDDTGAPKSCFFGGVQRGRISSQCLKRSWRTSEIFKSMGSSGIRTRSMPDLVGEKLKALGVADEYIDIAKSKLTGIANKDGKENSKGFITSQIVIYSDTELDRLAVGIKEIIDEDGSVKQFEKHSAKDFDKLKDLAKEPPVTADIALFGRMVTSPYLADIDAAMQVSHAISTHAVNRESDYFTAVDDLISAGDSDDSGAGMIGDVDYNSCCYYEYASIDTDVLSDNLKYADNKSEIMKHIVSQLVKAMAMSNPSGKQNTFAGQVFPSMVMVECKEDKIPLSYVNAFEIPVSTFGSKPEIVKNSIKHFTEHVDLMDHAYGLDIKGRLFFAPGFENMAPAKGTMVETFATLLNACDAWLA